MWRALARHRAALDERELALKVARRELEALESSPALAATEAAQWQQDLARQADELARRQHESDQQSAELEQDRKALAEAGADFEKTRRERMAACDQEWTRVRQLSRRREESLAHQQALLDRRARDLEIRHAATEQLRGEVDQTHREGLEMRLALEELWARIAQRSQSTLFARDLAQVRSQIADYYRYTNERLSLGHRKLGEAKAALECDRDEFRKQKDELLAWVERRRSELDEEEHELRRRALLLDERESASSEQQCRWHDERLAYQSQIRRLLAARRNASPGDAAATS
jgi:hypothetical protein